MTFSIILNSLSSFERSKETMISFQDDALTARLNTNIDRMVCSIVIYDSIRLLDQNGREVRRKIGGGIISDGLHIYYSV